MRPTAHGESAPQGRCFADAQATRAARQSCHVGRVQSGRYLQQQLVRKAFHPVQLQERNADMSSRPAFRGLLRAASSGRPGGDAVTQVSEQSKRGRWARHRFAPSRTSPAMPTSACALACLPDGGVAACQQWLAVAVVRPCVCPVHEAHGTPCARLCCIVKVPATLTSQSRIALGPESHESSPKAT
jgi:hypothetical protein